MAVSTAGQSRTDAPRARKIQYYRVDRRVIPKKPDGRLAPHKVYPLIDKGGVVGKVRVWSGKPFLLADGLSAMRKAAKAAQCRGEGDGRVYLYTLNQSFDERSWEGVAVGISEGWLVWVGNGDHHDLCPAASRYHRQLAERFNVGYDVEREGVPFYDATHEFPGAGEHAFSTGHGALHGGAAIMGATDVWCSSGNFDATFSCGNVLGLVDELFGLGCIAELVDGGRLRRRCWLPSYDEGTQGLDYELTDEVVTFVEACEIAAKAEDMYYVYHVPSMEDGAEFEVEVPMYRFLERAVVGARVTQDGLYDVLDYYTALALQKTDEEIQTCLDRLYRHYRVGEKMRENTIEAMQKYATVVQVGVRSDGSPITAAVVDFVRAKKEIGKVYLTDVGREADEWQFDPDTDTVDYAKTDAVFVKNHQFLLHAKRGASDKRGFTVRVPSVTVFWMTDLAEDGVTRTFRCPSPVGNHRTPLRWDRRSLERRFTVRGAVQDIIEAYQYAYGLKDEIDAPIFVPDYGWADAVAGAFEADLIEIDRANSGGGLVLRLRADAITEIFGGFVPELAIELAQQAFAYHLKHDGASPWSRQQKLFEIEAIVSGRFAVFRHHQVPSHITCGKYEGGTLDGKPRFAKLAGFRGHPVAVFPDDCDTDQSAHYASQALGRMKRA